MLVPLLQEEARRASWRVFLLVFLSAAYFYQSGEHNEATRFDQIRAISEHGELWIDRFASNTADVVHARGHTFPDKPPGTTILGLVPWQFARAILRFIPMVDGAKLTLTAWFVTLVLAAAPTALTALLILRFLARNGWTTGEATMAAVGYGLGTIAFPFGTMFFGHQVGAGFAFASFYLIWSCRFLEPGERTARLVGAGLMIGFLPLIENPGAIASGLLGLYAFHVLGLRASVPLVLASIVGVAPLPVYNALAFGDPLILSYSFHAKEGSAFPGQRQGFMGVALPRLDALRFITISPEKGLFYANPWLAVGLLAPFLVRRVRSVAREMGLALAIVVAFVVFNAGFGDSIVYWGGGYSFGPRYILICVPFLVLLAALALRVRFLAPLTAAAIAVTILVMLPPTAVEPRTPYLQEPLRTFAFPLYARGLYSESPSAPFGTVAVFGSHGSFNVGRVLGLGRDFEMVPLTLLWAFAAMRLFAGPGRAVTASRIAFATASILVGLWPAGLQAFAPGPRAEGLCRIVTADREWPWFADFALQPEPGPMPRRAVVAAPVLTPEAGVDSDPLEEGRRLAVSFSGDFFPRRPGWHRMRLQGSGRAAIYLNGRKRLMIDGHAPGKGSADVILFLAPRRHEILIRSMNSATDRNLRVLVAAQGASTVPVEHALAFYTAGCASAPPDPRKGP